MHSSVERERSVSSIRRIKAPSWCRAKSQLKSAVRAPPTWRWPVGLGAKRTRTVPGVGLTVKTLPGEVGTRQDVLTLPPDAGALGPHPLSTPPPPLLWPLDGHPPPTGP